MIVDSDDFEQWLRARLIEAGAAIPGRLHVGPGRSPAAGQSNDTVMFEVGGLGHDGSLELALVARLQPAGRQIFLSADVAREGRVLAGLHAAGTAPVPEVVGIDATGDVLGRPMFVMEQISGRVPLARPSIHCAGWLPELTAAQLTGLWSSALDTLVAVHRTDWRVHHRFLLEDLDAPGLLARHIDRLADWYRWTTKDRLYPITDAALEAVIAAQGSVTDVDPVLVWGDARVGNMIFGSDHRVAAAIDWEVATIGNPAIDLAHWLFFDEFMTSAAGVAPLAGWPDRASTIAEYERRSGRAVSDLDFFGMLDELFMATTLIRQSDFRVSAGLAGVDTRMGHDNAVTQMVARRLGLAVPPLSPDYIAHRTPTVTGASR